MNKRVNWVIEALIFGIIMLIFSVILDLFTNDFTWRKLPKQVITWLIAGLLYGFIMKQVYKRADKKNKNDS